MAPRPVSELRRCCRHKPASARVPAPRRRAQSPRPLRALHRAISLPRVNTEFETSYTPMLPVLVETLMSAYRELRGERSDLPESPRLALVDVDGSPSVPEFR